MKVQQRLYFPCPCKTKPPLEFTGEQNTEKAFLLVDKHIFTPIQMDPKKKNSRSKRRSDSLTGGREQPE